jgi:hypothetical protein
VHGYRDYKEKETTLGDIRAGPKGHQIENKRLNLLPNTIL